MASVLKALVTRMVKPAKELKTQENMVRVVIYCFSFFFCILYHYFVLNLMEIKYVQLIDVHN
jgi:hypothetical protein